MIAFSPNGCELVDEQSFVTLFAAEPPSPTLIRWDFGVLDPDVQSGAGASERIMDE